jgi:hypothetical protein
LPRQMFVISRNNRSEFSLRVFSRNAPLHARSDSAFTCALRENLKCNKKAPGSRPELFVEKC